MERESNDDDEAAYIDALFFLPGGILDPDDEGGNKDDDNGVAAAAPTSGTVPSQEATASSLLFPSPSPEPSWLESASTPSGEPKGDAPWLGQHLLSPGPENSSGFDTSSAGLGKPTSVLGQTPIHGSSDSLDGPSSLAPPGLAHLDQPPTLPSLSQLESPTLNAHTSWISSPTQSQQWQQHEHQQQESEPLSFPSQQPSLATVNARGNPPPPPPGFESAPLLSAEAPSFSPANVNIPGSTTSLHSEKSNTIKSKKIRESIPTGSGSTKGGGSSKGLSQKPIAKPASSSPSRKGASGTPTKIGTVRIQTKDSTGNTNSKDRRKKNNPPALAAGPRKNKNLPHRPKQKLPTRVTPGESSHQNVEDGHHSQEEAVQYSNEDEITLQSAGEELGGQQDTKSTICTQLPAKSKLSESPSLSADTSTPQNLHVAEDSSKQSDGSIVQQDSGQTQKKQETRKHSEGSTTQASSNAEASEQISLNTKIAVSKDQKAHSGKQKQNNNRRQQQENKEESTAESAEDGGTSSEMDFVLGLFASAAMYIFEVSNSAYGVCHQNFVWISEILLPALKQSALVIASSALHSLRGVFLVLFAAFHTYSFAADETLAELNLESAWIPYVTLIYAPTAARHLMNFVDLPQFTPHLVSSAVLCFLFRRPTGSPAVKRVSSKPNPEDLRNILLLCCQLLIPIDLFMDGFASVNTGIMTLCYSDRLLLAYIICVIRKGWILAPCAWLSFAVQCLVAVYFPWRHILAEPILLFVLFSIGMASLNVLRSLELLKIRAKKALGKNA